MRYLIALLFSVAVYSAPAQTVAGDWQGSISAGGKTLRIVFHISKSGDSYTATFDSPDQGAIGMAANGVRVTGDSIYIAIAVVNGGYNGKWDGANQINGALIQNAAQMPMNMQRQSQAAMPPVAMPKMSPVKSQTPKPPFDYLVEEVGYENKTQNVHLAGTFTRPKKGTRFPVVLMITGSGPQDRDETIGSHKAFWVIADYLAKLGIAVLRVDDRGIGKSTGNFSGATSADFAMDVMAGIQYLKSRPDVDARKIGLMGHSEGAIIAPYVAARSKDVAFVVMLAGPAEGGKKTMYYQAVTKALPTKLIQDAYGELYNQMLEIALQDSIAANAENYLRRIYPLWKSKQSAATMSAVLHGANLSDEIVVSSLIANIPQIKNPWMRFFLTYDPIPDLQKVTVPVLALNGSRDEQVNPSNLALIKNTMEASGNTKVKTYEAPGLNHLFQHCLQCGSIAEYMALEETFDVSALKIIGDWIINLK